MNTTSGSQTVTVTDTGNASLTIAAVQLAGTSPGDYLITSDACGGHTLLPGSTCKTSVAFRPAADSNRSATITYTDNAPGSPQTVALSGRGCRLLIGSICI
jgi:hypothetical protein